MNWFINFLFIEHKITSLDIICNPNYIWRMNGITVNNFNKTVLDRIKQIIKIKQFIIYFILLQR